MTDPETSAAAEALAHRVRLRDQAVRDGEDHPDAELFAQEYLTALRARGWRHTPAGPMPSWKTPRPGGGSPPSEGTRALLRQALETADAATAAQKAAAEARARETGSAA